MKTRVFAVCTVIFLFCGIVHADLQGMILGIGEDNYLYTRATLNSNWIQVPNSSAVIGVTVMPDGTILGIGTDKYLYTRATLNSNWIQVPNSGMVIGVTILHSDVSVVIKPYTFSAGTPAKAAEVNADFDMLYQQVNVLKAIVCQDHPTAIGCQ